MGLPGSDMVVDLSILLEKLTVSGCDPEFPSVIKGFTNDSRKVKDGDIFIAIAGTKAAGTEYLPDAQSHGAIAAIVDASLQVPPGITIPVMRVADAREALSLIAREFYGDPSRKLLVDAVIGTKGKTTSAFMTRSVMEIALGAGKAGVIGTLGAYGGGIEERTDLTTPESADLQRLLAGFVDAGAEQVSVEYTAHAIALNRGMHITFATGVFISFSQDHLDFFGTMDEYLATKVGFFRERASQEGFKAVVNVDDPAGHDFIEAVGGNVLTFGMAGGADLLAAQINVVGGKTSFELIYAGEKAQTEINAIGSYNVSNALAAAGVGLRHGLELEEVAAGLRAFEPVPGRLEAIREGQPFDVLVDYAHSPESVTAVLEGVSGLGYKRKIAVMGAGGDRDREKRPLIGEELVRGADLVIVTSDNPRTEDPEAIIEEILAGVKRTIGDREYFADPDRRSAIKTAIEVATPGDVVLILGKGAEDYQEINGVRHPFDDRVVCREILREMGDRWK